MPRGRKPDPSSKTQQESERLFDEELQFWRSASVTLGAEPGTAIVTSPGRAARNVRLPIVCSPTTKLHSATVRRRLARELLAEQSRLRERYADLLDPARVVARDAPKIAALRGALELAVKARLVDARDLEKLAAMERSIESMPNSLATALRHVREAGHRLGDPALVAVAGRYLTGALEEYWRAARQALDRD